ncbi:hypothetical protein IF1G_11142 [Cordyceps javanica]|uniref:Uncharacterized protein n=1 Tax=Cordyceps javanica TaxID=43265 RepID=A0A545UL51_9HYPO|nr:hypothetical protein IF1G_11142 [Cordyceps javanica]
MSVKSDRILMVSEEITEKNKTKTDISACVCSGAHATHMRQQTDANNGNNPHCKVLEFNGLPAWSPRPLFESCMELEKEEMNLLRPVRNGDGCAAGPCLSTPACNDTPNGMRLSH